MGSKKFDAVEMKRKLQREAEKKLSNFSDKEQLDLLRRKYSHLIKEKDRYRIVAKF